MSVDHLVSIFGYGSLMDNFSARRTMPRAKNFQPAILRGFERVYNLFSIGGVKDGSSNMDTSEVAALAIRETSLDSSFVFGCIFDIPESELGSYLEREHRYKAIEIDVSVPIVCDINSSSSPSRIQRAWTVVQQTDEEYRALMSTEEYHDRVLRFYKGKLWGRPDILPKRAYSNAVIAAAHKLGGKLWVSACYLFIVFTPFHPDTSLKFSIS
jgi:cation transport regulator ChaC